MRLLTSLFVLAHCFFVLNAADSTIKYPLHVAFYLENKTQAYETIVALLRSGVDVNARDVFGNTVLHCFAYEENTARHAEILSLLLAYGADFTLQNVAHAVPLDAVIFSGRFEVVRLFLEKGRLVLTDGQILLLRRNFSAEAAQELISYADTLCRVEKEPSVGSDDSLSAPKKCKVSVAGEEDACLLMAYDSLGGSSSLLSSEDKLPEAPCQAFLDLLDDLVGQEGPLAGSET